MSKSLSLLRAEFDLIKDDSGNRYNLIFKGGDNDKIHMAFTLDGFVLEAFVRQAIALIPSLNTELSSPEINASWRESAWPLKQLSDRSWQLLLREIFVPHLTYVLWYLKDIEITRGVVRNVSLRARDSITRSMINQFEGRDPDKIPQGDSNIRIAQHDLKVILETLNRLQDEGQI